MGRNFFWIALIIVLAAAGAFVLVEGFPGAAPVQTPTAGGGAEEERNFVTLGASISKGNNISSRLRGDHPEYSFSTGSEVESAYRSLVARGERLRAVNLASSGASSRDILERQVPNAVGYHPRYVTFDGGADFAIGVPVDEFRRNYEAIVAELKAAGDATILVTTYPDFTAARAAAPYSSCSETERLIGGGFRIANFGAANLERYNAVVRDVAAAEGLVLVDLYRTIALNPGDLSDYDCLHLSATGQQKFASALVGALAEAR